MNEEIPTIEEISMEIREPTFPSSSTLVFPNENNEKNEKNNNRFNSENINSQNAHNSLNNNNQNNQNHNHLENNNIISKSIEIGNNGIPNNYYTNQMPNLNGMNPFYPNQFPISYPNQFPDPYNQFMMNQNINQNAFAYNSMLGKNIKHNNSVAQNQFQRNSNVPNQRTKEHVRYELIQPRRRISYSAQESSTRNRMSASSLNSMKGISREKFVPQLDHNDSIETVINDETPEDNNTASQFNQLNSQRTSASDIPSHNSPPKQSNINFLNHEAFQNQFPMPQSNYFPSFPSIPPEAYFAQYFHQMYQLQQMQFRQMQLILENAKIEPQYPVYSNYSKMQLPFDYTQMESYSPPKKENDPKRSNVNKQLSRSSERFPSKTNTYPPNQAIDATRRSYDSQVNSMESFISKHDKYRKNPYPYYQEDYTELNYGNENSPRTNQFSQPYFHSQESSIYNQYTHHPDYEYYQELNNSWQGSTPVRKIGQINHFSTLPSNKTNLQRVRDAAKIMLQQKALQNQRNSNPPAKVVVDRSRLQEMLKKHKQNEVERISKVELSPMPIDSNNPILLKNKIDSPREKAISKSESKKNLESLNQKSKVPSNELNQKLKISSNDINQKSKVPQNELNKKTKTSSNNSLAKKEIDSNNTKVNQPIKSKNQPTQIITKKSLKPELISPKNERKDTQNFRDKSNGNSSTTLNQSANQKNQLPSNSNNNNSHPTENTRIPKQHISVPNKSKQNLTQTNNTKLNTTQKELNTNKNLEVPKEKHLEISQDSINEQDPKEERMRITSLSAARRTRAMIRQSGQNQQVSNNTDASNSILIPNKTKPSNGSENSINNIKVSQPSKSQPSRQQVLKNQENGAIQTPNSKAENTKRVKYPSERSAFPRPSVIPSNITKIRQPK